MSELSSADGYTRPMRLEAVTFDFWNTLYDDEHGGYDEVHEARLELFRELVLSLGGQLDEEGLLGAYQSGFEAYVDAWRQGRHFGAPEQIEHVLGRLGLASRDGHLAGVARRLEDVGAGARLALLPGAAEVIPALARSGVKIGLISDTGLTPGRILRRFLERDRLLPHFGALSFSDETGYPKPDPRMFLDTLERLGADPLRAAHVGDMPRTDIAGARAVGMVAVRFAASNDRDEDPVADTVIVDHRDLLPAVERVLAGRGRKGFSTAS